MSQSSGLGVDSELTPSIGGHSLGNRNRIALLEQIDALGSITQAAKAVPMSYKAAWDAIDAMNNVSPQPLVLRSTGGKGGGASYLTEFGREFVAQFRQLERQHQEWMSQLRHSATQPSLQLWERWNMAFSADNQLAGRISRIVTGAVNCEVVLTLNNGLELVGIATQDSLQQMNLRVGDDAFALIQAAAIIVATDMGTAKVSARNQMTGRIARIHTGSVNSVIAVDMGESLTLTVALTCESCEQMALAVNQEVTLLVKAPNVVFGCYR